MEALDNVRKSSLMSSSFFVENVAFQQAAIEEMERRAFDVTAMHPIKDKRARLRVAARYIKNGTVKFPRTRMRAAIDAVARLWGEKNTMTRVDALTYLVLGVVRDGIEQQVVHYV